MHNWTEKEWSEWKEERVAIMIHLGGLSVDEAKMQAGICQRLEMARLRSLRAEKLVEAERERKRVATAPAPQQALLFGMEDGFSGG